MLKGAIFDMDGTLLDSMQMWDQFGARYLLTQGVVAPADLNDHIRHMSLYQASEYFIETFHLQHKTPDDIIRESDDMIRDLYAYELQLKPGVKELLEELHARGVKMCLATATDGPHADAALTRLGVRQYFSEIFTCASVGHGKDEPVIYEESLRHLGTTKENTLVFEDALHAAKTARDAGFLLCGVDDVMEDRKEAFLATCHVMIYDFHDLDHFWAYTESL